MPAAADTRPSSPHPAIPPPAAGSKAWTRAELLHLGRTGETWTFVPLACRALLAHPEDHEVRFLLAATYVKLALGVHALRALDALPQELHAHPEVAALREKAKQIPDRSLDKDQRRTWTRDNVRAIAWREGLPRDLDEHTEAFDPSLHEAATVTNGSTMLGAPGQHLHWSVFQNDRGVADKVRLSERLPSPIVLDGLAAPLTLHAVMDRTPRTPEGQETPVFVLCKSISEMLEALSLADMRETLAQGRLRMFVGSDAMERFERHAAMRDDLPMGQALALTLHSEGAARWREGSLAESLGRINHAHRERLVSARHQIARTYDKRSVAWWRLRFADAASGRGSRLRILIPTTRFSTFLQHSAHDIAESLRAIGCDVRICIEPEATSRQTTLALACAMRQFEPDVILAMNVTRSQMLETIPANIPFITWVQDAKGELFRREIGSAMGSLDFVIGHLHEEFFKHFQYSRDRTLLTPVLVSPRKFHAQPVDAELFNEHACEVAYVSHQSETPTACRDRLLHMARGVGATEIVPVIEQILDPICRVTSRSIEAPVAPAIEQATRQACADVLGPRANPESIAMVLHSIARPIAERILRHQMLEWAASIAQRHGWRMRLYGRGWEQHPTLATYACGELPHGEALRASYQAAAVHLHASLGMPLHQRIMECALSGGLPLVRMKRDDFDLFEWHTQETIAARKPEFTALPEWPPSLKLLAAIAEHPEAQRYERMVIELGLRSERLVAPGQFLVGPESIKAPWASNGANPGKPMPEDDVWLLDEPARTMFHDEASLERQILRAVDDRDWRKQAIAGVARRTRRTFTYDRLASRLIRMLIEQLEAQTATAA